MLVLVLNSGGSSIKYQLLEIDKEEVMVRGVVANIGSQQVSLKHDCGGGRVLNLNLWAADHATGLNQVLQLLTDSEYGVLDSYADIAAVGHRVVHGGEKFREPVLVDNEVLDVLTECIELAPLHNPANILGIKICQQLMPGVPQVAVFDNTFHRDLPEHTYIYGLPYEYYQKYGVRRYGFHGISFSYIIGRVPQLVGADLKKMRIISLMLGSGCTVNAFAQGRSLDVSTGFTPNEGLLQSTRCGDVDAAALTYLMQKEGLTPAEMDEILYRKSGWLGVSGVSNDLKVVEEAALQGNSRARLAIDIFTYRAKKYIGAYAAAMGGVDLIAFTGGVGENSSMVREKICAGLEFLGIELDLKQNSNLCGEGLISCQKAKVPVIVVNVNEEVVVAKETCRILQTKATA